MDNETVNETENSVKNEPKRGDARATVAQSVDLLKKISDFTSKKDAILERLSEMSAKMQSKLNELGAKYPDAASGLSSAAPQKTFEQQPGVQPFPMTGGSHSEHHLHLPSMQAMSAPTSIKATRIRETKIPEFEGTSLIVKFPSKMAIDESWILASGVPVNFDDVGIYTEPVSRIVFQTGIRLAVPKGYALILESAVPELELISPVVLGFGETSELVVVMRSTIHKGEAKQVVLAYGQRLLKCTPVVVPELAGCEELLNSTFESWISGDVH